METILAVLRARVDAAVTAANGRRRTRLATTDAVMRLIRRILVDGGAVRATFGAVALSYGYRAAATQVTVARTEAGVRVWVQEGRAAKVHGGGGDFAESTRDADCRTLLARLPCGAFEFSLDGAALEAA